MLGGVRIGFTVDTTNFTAALGRYLSAVQNGKSRADLIKGQMKFLVRGLIDLTPPESLAQGRAAVKADITRAMSPWGGEDGQFKGIKNEGLRERLIGYLAASQYEKLHEVWRKIGARSSLQLLDFEPALHHRVQNSRGRVPTSQGVMVPQVKAWKAYVKEIQYQVGRARGGWAAAAGVVGLTLPEWVTRHSDGGDATVLVEPNRTTFTFVNRSVFIPRYAQNMELAISGRQKAMEVDVRRFLDGAKTFAGLT